MTVFVPIGFFLAAILYTVCQVVLAFVVGNAFAQGKVKNFNINFTPTLLVAAMFIVAGMVTGSNI